MKVLLVLTILYNVYISESFKVHLMWTKMGEHHAQIVSLYKQQISNFPLGFIGSNILAS